MRKYETTPDKADLYRKILNMLDLDTAEYISGASSSILENKKAIQKCIGRTVTREEGAKIEAMLTAAKSKFIGQAAVGIQAAHLNKVYVSRLKKKTVSYHRAPSPNRASRKIVRAEKRTAVKKGKG
jgi:hypothetical protein